MNDIVFVGITVAFFVLAALYAAVCEKFNGVAAVNDAPVHALLIWKTQ